MRNVLFYSKHASTRSAIEELIVFRVAASSCSYTLCILYVISQIVEWTAINSAKTRWLLSARRTAKQQTLWTVPRRARRLLPWGARRVGLMVVMALVTLTRSVLSDANNLNIVHLHTLLQIDILTSEVINKRRCDPDMIQAAQQQALPLPGTSACIHKKTRRSFFSVKTIMVGL